MTIPGNRRGINPSEDEWASCEDNPLSELMFDRGQTVIFNVRGRLCWDNDKVNIALMRILCMYVIARLTPIQEDELVPDRVVRRLQTVLARANVRPDNIYKMVTSVESCFRIASLTIPPRFLGSVYFSKEFQTLTFNSKGVYEDDNVEGVTYFDDVDGNELKQVLIKHYHCPKRIKEVQERNKFLVEDTDAYLMESIRQEEEHMHNCNL